MDKIKQRKAELEREIEKLKREMELAKTKEHRDEIYWNGIFPLEKELRGITFAQANELKFLEKLKHTYDRDMVNEYIKDRIEELKLQLRERKK